MSLLEQDNKKSLREWANEHVIGLIILGMIVLFGSLFATTWDRQVELYNGFVEFGQMIEQNQEWEFQLRTTLRNSDDCNKLKDAINNQLSLGANPDSWVPSNNDKALKIGQHRYDVLGCKP